MQVFVTGGTGFIGANVIRLLLQEGHSVRALVRPNSRLDNLQGLNVEKVTSDLNDPDLWQQMQGCEALFHVAAYYSLWQSDRERLHQANVLGTRNCLAAANRAGIKRTVYTSSAATIGLGPQGVPVDETHQSPVEDLIGHYRKSKYWAEQEAFKAISGGQDIVIVNPTSPIGAWDVRPTPTGNIIVRFLRQKMPFYLADTGLNFVDVQDVAWGHLLALQKGHSGDRYILGNQNMKLKAMLDLLEDFTGISAPTRSIPVGIPLAVAWIEENLLARLGRKPTVPLDGVRKGTKTMYYDASKAVKELGLPQTPILQALQREVDWFVANGYAA
ncbi:NAD-dependent epimerase/dehydratase family protein [soil metagenome]